MPDWTKEQKEAIDKSGTNIIVSAGAGSGKTAVLSERVLQKVLNGTNVDRLLILTFTNLAAAEMKDRIRDKIKKEPNLKEQLNKIDSSYITTFDSYALSVVKKYHYLLNISASVNIIDKNLLDIKINETIDNIFEELYKEENKCFLKLINDLCIKDDLSLKKEIISINSKLDMCFDKDNILDNYINNYYSESYIKRMINDYINLIKNKAENIKLLSKDLYNYVDIDYGDLFYNQVSKLFGLNNYDDYLVIETIKLPNLKKGSMEEAKIIKDQISDLIKEIKEYVRFSSLSELVETYLSTKDYLEAIIEIIKRLDKVINEYKFTRDTYDFVDISKFAIKIVKEYPNIRDEIKYSFDEILIDEYQDTNDLQEEFIKEIENNNTYMVGDIKQSIYRFRNANPNIFKNKYDRYSNLDNGIKIDLLKNFRSRREVLGNINIFFQYILDDRIGGADYRKSHEMVFGNDSYEKNGTTGQNNDFEILEYDNQNCEFNKDEIEAFIIANDIINKVQNNYKVFDKNKKIIRDIKYSDFSILVDRSTIYELYNKVFLYKKIPLNIVQDKKLDKSDDFLCIKNIFKLLYLVNNKIYNEEYRFSFLSVGRSFLFNLDDDYLFNIIKNKEYSSNIIVDKIKNILINIDSCNLSDILDLIIEEFDYYNKLLSVPNINENILRIDYLYNLATTLNDQGMTYIDFSNYIDNINKNNLEIRFSPKAEMIGGVSMMSIHKSKGLEFHICYFPCLYKKFNDADLKGKFLYDRNYGIMGPYFKEGIGNIFIKDLYKEFYRKEDIGEKIRLFYVAMTRAKEKMILVVPKSEGIEDYKDDVVIDDIRLKYKSFLSMITSIKSKLTDYIKEVNLNDLNLSKDYNLISGSNVFSKIKINKENINIIEKNIKEKELIKESHYSKNSIGLINQNMKENMEFGTYIHYLLEIIDFKKKDLSNYQIDNIYKEKIDKFLNSDLLKDIDKATVYKEYEFISEEDNEIKKGIIDLMLEYENHIDIIDYKLKNIDDINYNKQLNGYKEYIENLTNKKTNIYLYSIMDSVYKKIDV